MEKDRIVMSQRQLQRWHVMGLLEAGKITLKEAAEKIGVSYREAKRRKRAVFWGVIDDPMRYTLKSLSRTISNKYKTLGVGLALLLS